MKNKLIALITVGTMLLSASVVSAYKYEPPYDEIDGGRAEQNMPQIISLTEIYNRQLADAYFDDNTFSSDTLALNYNTAGAVITGDGTVKIEKNSADEAVSFALKYIPTSDMPFNEGDVYALTCDIKGENIQKVAPRTILEAYSGSNKWLSGTTSFNGKGDMLGTNDWYTMTQFLIIPKNTSYLNLQMYLAKTTTGTVYFDNFRLYRVALDPVKTVLRTPNYKGLIFGDDYCNIDLDVLLSLDTYFYDPGRMELTVQLLDGNDNVIYISQNGSEALTEKMNFVFPADGLAEGDYYLQTILTDTVSRVVLSKKEHTIRKRSENYRPDAYVDEDGNYVRNGEKTLINKMYHHSAVKDVETIDAAEAAVEMGVDTLSNYGMWWAVENRDEEVIDFLKDNSLGMHICLSSYWFSDRSNNEGKKLIEKQSDILPMFTEIAQDYKNEEFFEGYYLFDEPDPVFVGDEIRWNNEIMAQADINHPTFGVADREYDKYGMYANMADILGIDPYPITGKTDETGAYTHDIAKIGRSVRQIKENFPERPVYYVMQGFHYASRGDLRSPNYDELRNMAWQALCEGAAGLEWYAYPEMTVDTTKPLDQWKEEVKTLLDEVKSYKDVFLSTEPAPKHSVTGGGDWLNYCVKRYNGKTYLFAVNNTYTEQSATINIDGVGDVELDFDSLGVIMREFTQSDFLSPEAELINMGLSNGNQVFMSSDGDVIKVYVPAESGVINYTAKISDDASLYIGNVEIPSKGKITVRNIDEFTLKVIAEDGKTIFCQSYQVVKE